MVEDKAANQQFALNINNEIGLRSIVEFWWKIKGIFWKPDTSCEWAPYRQDGGTNGYRCKCNDGYYGWKCELRLIF